MKIVRVLMIGLLAGTLTIAACGKKGPPIRPGEETKQEETE